MTDEYPPCNCAATQDAYFFCHGDECQYKRAVVARYVAASGDSHGVTPEQQSAYNELNVERYHAIQELQRKVSELEAQLQQAQKDVEGWKHDFNMYRSAWLREMGGVIVPKHHEIDGFVLRAREIYEKAKLVDRMKKILCDQEKAKVGAMEMFDAVFKFLAEDKHDKVPTN